MRIAVGGIEHETCGFAAPSPTAETTTLMSVARSMKFGDELRSLGAANTIVDGLVRGVRETGHELVPLLWIDANTSPPVTRESLESAIEDFVEEPPDPPVAFFCCELGLRLFAMCLCLLRDMFKLFGS